LRERPGPTGAACSARRHIIDAAGQLGQQLGVAGCRRVGTLVADQPIGWRWATSRPSSRARVACGGLGAALAAGATDLVDMGEAAGGLVQQGAQHVDRAALEAFAARHPHHPPGGSSPPSSTWSPALLAALVVTQALSGDKAASPSRRGCGP
jgi:hypothetical protein